MSNINYFSKMVTGVFLKRITSLLLLSTACLASHAEVPALDFDAAMDAIQLDVKADINGNGAENGIPDGDEMALLAAILADPELDLSASGGIQHEQLYEAYQKTLVTAKSDLASVLEDWPTAAQVSTAFTLLGRDSHDAINQLTSRYSAPLKSDYSAALKLASYLSAEGDADGDGFSNRQEYHASVSGGPKAYIQMALDPDSKPSPQHLSKMKPLKKTQYTVGIILYPGFEVLDVFGPMEMWAYVPSFDIKLVAQKAGPVRSAQGARVEADFSFADAPELDIILVPGGNGTVEELNNPILLDYLQKAHKHSSYTTSVCTGSALLAKAGILDGHQATSNKRFFFLSQQQSKNVQWLTKARWVESGKVFSSSGVSAGMDMALALVAEIYGRNIARKVASDVEYIWHETPEEDPFAHYANAVTSPKIKTGESLIQSTPSANSRLGKAPHFLHLIFNETPLVEKSKIALYSVANRGSSIPLKSLHTMYADDLMISVSEELEDGKYLIEWQTVFEEKTETQRGSFHFQVEAKQN